jgi:hypothetical protein
MGILVQLGQDTNELTGEKSWWEKVPSYRRTLEETEVSADLDSKKQDKYKDLVDPLSTVRRYLGTEGVQGIIKKSRKSEESELLDSKKDSKKAKKKKKKKDKKNKTTKKGNRREKKKKPSWMK